MQRPDPIRLLRAAIEQAHQREREKHRAPLQGSPPARTNQQSHTKAPFTMPTRTATAAETASRNA